MDDRSKKIFLAICIIVPFVLYCVYYYGVMIKNAPYKFSEFKSIQLKYGLGNNLVNQYDSQSGAYQYADENDSLVKTTVKLSKDELLYLHRKASELGFWNFPEVLSPTKPLHQHSPHYYIEYSYVRKHKHVLFDMDYDKDSKLKNAITQLIKELSKTISDAQDRSSKQADIPKNGRRKPN